MNKRTNRGRRPSGNLIRLIAALIMLLGCVTLSAQPDPPRPITVTTTQDIAFGAFYHGSSGGDISITTTGSRSANGDIILLGLGYVYSAAWFDIVANEGTLINLVPITDITLTGSNGGTMTLHFGVPDPEPPFVTTAIPPATTQMKIGGTLSVLDPGSNPPGNYSGTFDLIFIQE